jgi:hypothetical protein
MKKERKKKTSELEKQQTKQQKNQLALIISKKSINSFFINFEKKFMKNEEKKPTPRFLREFS